MNSLAKLYKYTTKGQVQSWQIFYENNYYWTEEGIHTLSVSDPTYCAGKNIGKANETSPEQQALLEAKAMKNAVYTSSDLLSQFSILCLFKQSAI